MIDPAIDLVRAGALQVDAERCAVRLKVDRTDSDIADDVARALRLRPVPERVQATVHNGHVTLTGRVEWLLQKVSPEDAVRHIRGVRGVLNYIEVSPNTTQRDVSRRIVQALHRNADLDARQIRVAVSDDVVTLSGAVRSCRSATRPIVRPAAHPASATSKTRSSWNRRHYPIWTWWTRSAETRQTECRIAAAAPAG